MLPGEAGVVGVALLIVRKARIALLEGERRSFDNVKLDLMRRIKMLEYALRVERYAFIVHSLARATH